MRDAPGREVMDLGTVATMRGELDHVERAAYVQTFEVATSFEEGYLSTHVVDGLDGSAQFLEALIVETELDERQRSWYTAGL